MTSVACSFSSVLKTVFLSVLIVTLCLFILNLNEDSTPADILVSSNKFENVPLIFIGGFPRSGTTLVRAILDTHPDVRCGQETRVIPDLMQYLSGYLTKGQWLRLDEAGVTYDVVNNATASFIYTIIAGHGSPAPRLCNKDPFTLRNITWLSDMFPSAKFVFMVRDGRAVTHSVITRKVTIGNYNISDWESTLHNWNSEVEIMWTKCLEAGESKCLQVHYESLILRPREQLHRLFEFLELSWTDNVLHHQDFVDKTNGITLSKTEPSTNQVKNALYVDSLSSWIDSIPANVRDNASAIAPMLEILGYDVISERPEYGKPEPEIAALINKDEALTYFLFLFTDNMRLLY